MRLPLPVAFLAGALLGLGAMTPALAAPFTYQGLLKDSGSSAADYDFRVEIFDATDNVIAGPFFFEDVPVDSGRFTLVIDPGSMVFDGGERNLVFGVRRGGETGSYTALSPPQRLRATPYAQHADDADFAAQVAPGSITAVELANGAVGSAALADGGVASVDLADFSVVAATLADNAVSSRAISDGTIVAPDFADLSVGEAKLNVAAVSTNKLQDGAVTTSKLAANAVGAAQIDATQVQRRVGGVSGSCTVGAAVRAINEDGSVVCESFPSTANLWSLSGNAGTTPGTHYLGTTDAQAFEIRTRGSRHLRIEPSTTLSAGAPVTANIIAGSAANIVSSGVRGASIGGGGTPSFFNDPEAGSIGPNAVVSHYGVVAGGVENIAGGDLPFGTGNAYFAAVGGGRKNFAAGRASVVSGGSNNRADATEGTVSGGSGNMAWGFNSSVPGGGDNCAGGYFSLAAGANAKVRPAADPGAGACAGLASYVGNSVGDAGTFVWADTSNFVFLSTGSNRFEVRSTGGVRFVTGINASGVPDAGVKLDADDNAWEVLSDRQAKAGIKSVEPEDVLARLLALPIYTWHYTAQGAATQHIGPMAQDFHAAFGFNGDDDRHISTLDPDGVALAAIQGVYAHFGTLREADVARIVALESDNAAMRATLSELSQRLRTIEAAARNR